MVTKTIYIFIGSPMAGKETQTTKLSSDLSLPVFSMGELIRNAKDAGDQVFMKAYEEYSMKGLHLPIDIKFGLLEKKMDESEKGFILDNFPATEEDLSVFETYIRERELIVNKAFYLQVSEEEMRRRFDEAKRNRADDVWETLLLRRRNQDKDREPVIQAFKNLGILVEIDGNKSIEEVYADIRQSV